MAVRDSEDLLGEDIHAVHGGMFVAWALRATLCEHVLNTLAKNSAHFSNQDLHPFDKGQTF